MRTYPSIRNAAVAILFLAACRSSTSVDGGSAAITPTAPVCTALQPTGATLDRWKLTGGLDGPLGCMTGKTQPVTGRAGSVTPFANGQIVTSPDQGPNMTVAVYQQGPELYVDWGDSTPFHYDRFLVRWDIDGVNAGQVDVPMQLDPNQTIYVPPHEPRTRGVFAIPLPRAGNYSIIVEGCDYTSTGSDCKQGWTVPATITYVPPPPPPPGIDCGIIPPDGPIRQRWLALGGMFGPLGCATSGPTAPPGGASGQVVTFRNGQIGWAPAQGHDMTVAAYQAETDVVVEWGDTSPFHYDKFNVRWSKDDLFIVQNEIRQPLADAGAFVHGIDHTKGVGPGKYSVVVEGCDDGTFGSDCKQGFTFPVVVNVHPPAAYDSTCATVPSGVIGERWSRIVGAHGPLLGCPTGPEQPLGDGKVQSFDRGQIVWSPDQGAGMTVAMYQVSQQLNGQLIQQLKVEWGDTFPFSYDKFIIRVNGDQADVTQDGASNLTSLSSWYPYNPQAPSLPVGATYTAIVEGCDTSAGGSTCKQGWTLPVSVTIQQLAADPPMPGIDFTTIPAATSAADMPTHLADRTLAIDTWDACKKTLGDIYQDEEDFVTDALAKLDLVDRGFSWCAWQGVVTRPRPIRDEVNSALRFQQVRSATGSSSDTPVVCTRTGEYDVALSGLVPMVYKYGRLLDDDVRAHIVNDLLDARGPALQSEFSYCSVVPETENHLNQIESARYLTNQLLYRGSGNQLYNNETNGMNDFILDRLQTFLQKDFLEYNARPYTTYSVDAIQNLFDYATDRRVKRAAQLVLDYLSAKYAVSSNTMRRQAPYRRRVGHYDDDLFGFNADAMSARMLLTTGMVDRAPWAQNDADGKFLFGWTDMQMAAISSYRLPTPVADFMFDATNRSYFERIHHYGVEIYSSTPEYLISAGGYYTHSPYLVAGIGKHDDDGPVVPTTLMPTGSDRSVQDLIRIDGFNKEVDLGSDRRLNTCVAPDFACGVSLRIPDAYFTKLGCMNQKVAADGQGLWVFIDAATVDPTRAIDCTNGSRTGRFMVAAYLFGGRFGDNRGFFEAHAADGMTFDAFQAAVLAKNFNRTFQFDTMTPNSYTTLSGRTIQFVVPFPGDGDKSAWTITSTGDAALDGLGNDIDNWPLASGDVLSGDGKGLVTFKNAGLRSNLILDFTDAGEPKRLVTMPRLPPPPKCPPGTHDCGDGTCAKFCQ